jgi:hypothetical protein
MPDTNNKEQKPCQLANYVDIKLIIFNKNSRIGLFFAYVEIVMVAANLDKF